MVSGFRELVYATAGIERLVSVTIYTPTPIDSRFETRVQCKYQIDGLGSRLDLADNEPHCYRFEAADSIQALIFALQGIQIALRQYESSLSWLDMKGDHGFPLVVYHSNDFGADFRQYIEALVEDETAKFVSRKYPHRRT